MKAPSTMSAFTLIELLVVITIIALLYSMIISIPDNDNPEDNVKYAAQKLADTLREARKLAITTGANHGVVFNIENSGDGSILKNYSQYYDGDEVENGRMWYAIIGPDQSYHSRSRMDPPIPGFVGETNILGYKSRYGLRQAIESNLVGEVCYLPEGVRFLSLTDNDKGNYKIGNTEVRYYGDKVDQGATYPRPWFGYYDPNLKRLFAWGGYDPDIDNDINDAIDSSTLSSSQKDPGNGVTEFSITGLVYEGADGPIPYDSSIDTNVNPNPTYGRQFYSTAHGDFLARYPNEVSSSKKADDGTDSDLTVVGKSRPLIEGFGGDFMILFQPNKEVRLISAYNSYQYYEPTAYSESDKLGKKVFRGAFIVDNDIHITGGMHITLCRDVDPEDEIYFEQNANTQQPAYNKFNTVEDAFASISPYRRVYINQQTGLIEVRDPFHPHAYLEAGHLLNKDSNDDLDHTSYPVKDIPDE